MHMRFAHSLSLFIRARVFFIALRCPAVLLILLGTVEHSITLIDQLFAHLITYDDDLTAVFSSLLPFAGKLHAIAPSLDCSCKFARKRIVTTTHIT